MNKENANISFIISIFVICSNNILNVLDYSVLLKLISLFLLMRLLKNVKTIYTLHVIFLLDRTLRTLWSNNTKNEFKCICFCCIKV